MTKFAVTNFLFPVNVCLRMWQAIVFVLMSHFRPTCSSAWCGIAVPIYLPLKAGHSWMWVFFFVFVFFLSFWLHSNDKTVKTRHEHGRSCLYVVHMHNPLYHGSEYCSRMFTYSTHLSIFYFPISIYQCWFHQFQQLFPETSFTIKAV